jgi:hypothetical protein
VYLRCRCAGLNLESIAERFNAMSESLSWREKVIYPLIVALMIGCCLFVLVQAVERYAGSHLDLTLVTCIGMLAALQSFYVQRLIVTLRIGGVKQWAIYLLELVVLLVLSRLGLFANDILAGRQAAFDFFTMEWTWLLVIGMMALAWWFARSVSVQFSRLQRPSAEGPEYIDSQWVSPYDALRASFLWGGIGLMLCAGIARIDLSEFEYAISPPAAGVIPAVILYFGLGLLLLGQARFDGARRRWMVDKVKVAEQTSARWLRYSLVLSGIAALVAFLIPVSYSLGLLDALRTVMSFVLGIISSIFMLIVFVIGLIGRLVDLLLGQPVAPEEPAAPADLRELFPSTASTSGPNWLAQLNWASIQSALSWLIALAVIVYVGWTYLRDHPTFSQGLGEIKVLHILANIWRAIWNSIIGMAGEAGETVKDAFQRLVGERSSGRPLLGRLLRLGGSSPRERVRALYMSTLSRAAGQGIVRRDSQTPYEYEAVLEPRVPTAADDVEQLTEAFVKARYAQHPIGDEDVAAAHDAWLRLRSALRRRMRARS